MKLATAIEAVRIKGFRSLADIEVTDLGNLAVLIGSNGSGKSNFIRFFEMLGWMIRSRKLGEFIQRHGGADDHLFNGSSQTPRMEAEISIRTSAGLHEYKFSLGHAQPDRLLFTEEAFRSSRGDGSAEVSTWHQVGDGNSEANIVEVAQSTVAQQSIDSSTAGVIVQLLRNCSVFQFHDTSDTSAFKMNWDVSDCRCLRGDGGNLATVLHHLERTDLNRYERICSLISRVVPAFDRFVLDERHGRVILQWKARGSGKTLGAHLTSDGSLRFFALTTLLNLPAEMLPDVIMLDEPELGLHPAAIPLLGGMIRSLSTQRQVIAATQSPLLVNSFSLDGIVVFEHANGRTECHGVDAAQYQNWLADGYLAGDLWWKNIIGGYP